jgi:hypothetical protein
VTVAVLLAVGLGWFVPLLGTSLAAFLVVDAALGWWGRSSASRTR